MFSKASSSKQSGTTPWKGDIWGILLFGTIFGRHYWHFVDLRHGGQTWSFARHCLVGPTRTSCALMIIWAENLTILQRNSKCLGHGFNISWIFSEFFRRRTKLCFIYNFTKNCSVFQENISLTAVIPCIWVISTRNLLQSVAFVVIPLCKRLTTSMCPVGESCLSICL